MDTDTTVEESQTETGLEKQINEQVTLDLLIKFHQLHDGSAEQLHVKEAIITELYSMITSVVQTFVPSYEDFFNDVMQECLIKVTKAISSWRGNVKGTIGGYFRRTVANQCRTVLKRESKITSNITSYDRVNTAFLQNMGVVLQDFTVVRVADLFTGQKQKAYEYALHWIQDMGFEEEGFGKLQKRLVKLYELSLRSAGQVIDHAKVTMRMEYVDKAPSLDLEAGLKALPPNSMFHRMLPYIKEGDIRSLLKIFMGIDVRIPRCY